jgi:hypothetical protein
MNLLDQLKKHAVSTKKIKKDSHPEIQASSLEACWKCAAKPEPKQTHCPKCNTSLDLADACYQAHQEFKTAESTFRLLESNLIQEVMPEYKSLAKQEKFSKTISVPGEDTPGVKLSWKDMFSKLDINQEKFLKDKLGERYQVCFKQERSLQLLDTSDAALSLLQEKLGEDFLKLFQIKLSLACQENMDQKQFNLPDPVKNLLVQSKPSLTLNVEK